MGPLLCTRELVGAFIELSRHFSGPFGRTTQLRKEFC